MVKADHRVINEINLRIGDKEYAIVSDDDYLNHIKPGFEPQMVKLFECLVSKNDHALDVGANIGCTSILFGELCKRVYSFEPSPTTFGFLGKNVASSGLTNIEIHNYALGAETGESTITFSPNDRSGAFISNLTKAAAGHTTEKIRIRRMDDVVDELSVRPVDFIKIDVEGFEKHVIDGAAKTIDRFKPIVVLELNHWCLNAFQRITVPDFLDYLSERFPILLAIEGNEYANLHDDTDRYIVMYHHIIHFKYLNLLCAFSEDQLHRFHSLFRHQTC